MPADILLDLPRERYHWLLVQPRTPASNWFASGAAACSSPRQFYAAWPTSWALWSGRTSPSATASRPDFPQHVWEAQVMQTIFRLRNHPSLALYCGGNEFNPYR